jgi:hypothetical protein
MTRILIKWFHLDVGMMAIVSVFDSAKNEHLAEWNVDVESFQNLKHYPLKGDGTLPPLCQSEELMSEVDAMLRNYLDGYAHKSETHKWIKQIKIKELS